MKENIEHNVKIHESKSTKILSIALYSLLYIWISIIPIKDDSEMIFWYITISTPILIYYIFRQVKKIRKPPKKILVISIDGISVAPYGFV